MQHSQCFPEKVSGLRKMMEHVDAIDGAETVIWKRQSIGRQNKIDKGQNFYVAGDHFRVDIVNNAGSAPDFQSLTRAIAKVTQVHPSALFIETLKQSAQDELALNDLAVRNRKSRT